MTPLVTFVHPLALLLLPVLVLVVYLGGRRVGTRWRVATALRAAMVGLLIVATSGPAITAPQTGTSVIFAVDRSLSIPEAGRRAEAEFVEGALRRMHPGDQAGIVTFAGRPLLRAPLRSQAAVDDLGPALDPDATDIGAAIELSLRLLPGPGARRIVVLSDGAENRGDALAAARLAAASGVAVDAVPVVASAPAEVLVEDVEVPQGVHVGEAFEVRAVLRATVPAEATVTLRRLSSPGGLSSSPTGGDRPRGEGGPQGGDGLPVASRRVSLAPGVTAVRFSEAAGQQQGTIRYRVDIAASPGTSPDNKHGEALVVVRGRPRVLFVSESPSRLSEWLAGQGLRIDVRRPDAIPSLATEFASYGSVVLDNVAAADLSTAQQEALRTFAGVGGGGVVAIGGPRSFGIGGYAGTPLEELLPVKMDVRQTTVLPTVALVLLIDTSGSMEAFGTELAKVELAKEIASSAIDLLGQHDQIGVMTFDQEYRWIVPPTEARNRARILDQVARLRAGGGTVMYPPLAAVRTFLRQSPAKVRHVVVLSDGLTDPGDFRELATAMAREKITVSTVAIGQDADLEFMRNLARWGRGRTYVAKDIYGIPEIFTTEALVAVRSYIVEEAVQPLRLGPAPTLVGLSPPPPLAGYIATVPKPAADVALLSQRRDPLLATWQYGLGRTVAFMSDDGQRWTGGWAAWPDVARFWSQAIRWTLRDEGPELHLVTARADQGATAHAVLDARRPDGAPWDGLAVSGQVDAPGGVRRAITLEQTAPGRYEGTWPASRQGVYTLTVAARDAGRAVGSRTVGLVVPYSPELRAPGGNPALLSRLAEATGGIFLHAPQDAFRPGHGRGTRDVWPPLAGAALGLLLAEVTVRRVPALAQHLGASGAFVAGWVRGASRVERPAPGSEDQAYDAADRWAAENERFAEEDALRAASMDNAARLYIARLRGSKRP